MQKNEYCYLVGILRLKLEAVWEGYKLNHFLYKQKWFLKNIPYSENFRVCVYNSLENAQPYFSNYHAVQTFSKHVRAKSLQFCLTLCDPTNCSLPGSSVHRDSPGKNTGMDCHALLQGIFPT